MTSHVDTHILYSRCPTCESLVSEFIGHLKNDPNLVCASCQRVFSIFPDSLNQAIYEIRVGIEMGMQGTKLTIQ